MRYTAERKEAVVRKMLPPSNKNVPTLSKEEGIPEQTLYAWRMEARAQGRLVPHGEVTPDGWTSADKFTAVVETAPMNEEEKAEYCRKRGLHTEQLAVWRQACMNANDWDRAQARKLRETMAEERKRAQALEKELRRKEKALAEAAALLVLKKKVDDLWGESGDE